MALNLYMHSRNPYKNKKPSFKNLAEKYPFFADVTVKDDNGKICPEFKQPRFLAALARALLLEDFDLDVEVPVDRLIPTIPLRLNYILWIEDILSCKNDCLIIFLSNADQKFSTGHIGHWRWLMLYISHHWGEKEWLEFYRL